MHQPQTTPDNACQPLSPHIAQAIAPYNPAQPQYWNALWRSTLEASRASGRGCECWQNWNELAEARNMSRSELIEEMLMNQLSALRGQA